MVLGRRSHPDCCKYVLLAFGPAIVVPASADCIDRRAPGVHPGITNPQQLPRADRESDQVNAALVQELETMLSNDKLPKAEDLAGLYAASGEDNHA